MKIFDFITNTLFVLALGFYLICALQWFSYKFSRIIFHFTKPLWHVAFLITPLILYYLLNAINPLFFAIYFYCVLLVMMIFWHFKLDKKLVFTVRVKMFFVILFAINLSLNLVFVKCEISPFAVILPLGISLIISAMIEKIKSVKFKKTALKKLNLMPNLTIIEITASYGKTSIKNFLYQILKDDFKTYKTPRSVNTLMGLVKDINENLDPKTQIYIAEAGARKNGDIDEITKFLKPQIVVVGEIGSQHIEYFKTLSNIRQTKLEALNSINLQMAFLHSSTQKNSSEKIVIYDEFLSDVSGDLDGISFKMSLDKVYEFHAPILGKFNASNLAVCILIARFLGLEPETIKEKISKIKSVEHRLEVIKNGGKFIIDDSFNGNFNGMVGSYELVKNYDGKKVIITPGIVEATKDMNENLAKIINEIFDLIIVTGELNAGIFSEICDKNKLLILKDKSLLTKTLGEKTKAGDLILFSNDAPNFI